MIDFRQLANDIDAVEEKLKTMTFEEAVKHFSVHYCDEELCDFDCGRDMIGTINNNNGRPYISEHTYFEIFQNDDRGMPYIALMMTKEEIKEQAYRLDK